MLQELKRLLKSKISVTVVYPSTDGVKHSTTPTVVESNNFINKVRRSDYRFVSETKTDFKGQTKTYYMTEKYEKGRWSHVSETFSGDKNEAMQLHLLILEKGSLDPTCEKVVHWEGLSKEEATTWVALSTDNR